MALSKSRGARSSQTDDKPVTRKRTANRKVEEELEEVDDELEDDDETQDDDDDTDADDSEEEEEEEEELDGVTLKQAVKEISRLRGELRTLKKENITLRKKATSKSDTKVDDTKDDEIAQELEETKTTLAEAQTILRDNQVERAIVRYLGEIKRPEYAASARYIAMDLDLSDDDIEDKRGLYDKDLLKDAVADAAKAYIKANPRRAATSDDDDDDEDELASRRKKRSSTTARRGVGGNPPRGNSRLKATKGKTDLNDAYGGLLTNPMFRQK